MEISGNPYLFDICFVSILSNIAVCIRKTNVYAVEITKKKKIFVQGGAEYGSLFQNSEKFVSSEKGYTLNLWTVHSYERWKYF